jgi:hypothetical protein
MTSHALLNALLMIRLLGLLVVMAARRASPLHLDLWSHFTSIIFLTALKFPASIRQK